MPSQRPPDDRAQPFTEIPGHPPTKLDLDAEQWRLHIGATGGALGVAATAGRKWALSGVVWLLVMAALATIQRITTGM